MCRLLAYLGAPIRLDRLLYEPSHSLIVQSYQPLEMTSGLLNADGFGVGWYHLQRPEPPFTYRNLLPIWNDVNLPSLSRYVESSCVLANVRSATPGLAVDLSNCQPFQREAMLFVHNGFIENFRQTLYRPLRDRLSDALYTSVHGTTDSEHLFALVLNEWTASRSLSEAVQHSLRLVSDLAAADNLFVSANCIFSDGHQLVACRTATRSPVPTLYWLQDDACFPDAVVVASEPLNGADWNLVPEHSLLTVDESLHVKIQGLFAQEKPGC